MLSLIVHAMLGVLVVWPDLEGHMVAEVEPAGLLQVSQDRARRAHHPQVDILRRSRSCESELEHESALDYDRISHCLENASEKSFEHEELATARECGAGRRPCLEPLLDGLLER